MKNHFWFVTSLLTLCGGIALAQAVEPKGPAPKTEPTPSATSGAGPGRGMMGPGMMGSGMMGPTGAGMGMMESCSCSSETKGVRVEVKKLPKGVSITYSSDDALTVARIQKRAEAVRLMHESCSQ